MKKLKIISAFFIFVFLFTSCKKEDGSNPVEPGSNSTGTFTASINNSIWKAGKVRAYKESNFTRINGTEDISDNQSPYNSISVFIDILYLQNPRLFAIGEDGKGFVYNAHAHVDYKLKNPAGKTETYTAEYIENLSQVNITTINENRIEGTFSFRAFLNSGDSINVTNGNFSITF